MSRQTETESALAAMDRAATRARTRASLFGSRLAVWRDGAVVLLDPRRTGAEQGGADQPTTDVEAKSEGDEKAEAETDRRSQ